MPLFLEVIFNLLLTLVVLRQTRPRLELVYSVAEDDINVGLMLLPLYLAPRERITGVEHHSQPYLLLESK